jgi:hypothetical protein
MTSRQRTRGAESGDVDAGRDASARCRDRALDVRQPTTAYRPASGTRQPVRPATPFPLSMRSRFPVRGSVRALAPLLVMLAMLPVLGWPVRAATAQGAPRAASASEPPPVTLPNTRTHVLRSTINGQEYHIAVALPLGHRGGSAADTARYPVLYVLDGGAHLPLLASMFRLTNRSGATGDVILVGVGYYPPGAFPRAVPGQTPRRNVDYSPPRLASPGAGTGDTTALPWPAQAPDFLRVLRDEIIPLVDRTYPTSARRALHGHSLGGLFATYVLFEEPELFDRYAIVSPSYWWDGGSMFAREAAFRARRTSLSKEIFLGVGALEGPDQIAGMWRMTAALCAGRRAGPYRGLEITAEVIPGEHHGSALLFGRALRAFYPPYPVDSGRTDVCASR